MQSGEAGFIGHSPIVSIGKASPLTEQRKYERMWERPEYRAGSPGEIAAQDFLRVAHPKAGAEIIDFGTGTGRGALALAFFGGLKVTMLDFAENCLDDDVRKAVETQPHALRFLQHDLMQPSPVRAQYGYCTDVMEHIPPGDVDRVLSNVLMGAQHVFFQIACEDDVMGKLIGQPLHLTVQPYAWWLAKLQSFDCLVQWSQDLGTHCCFYVTAWQDGAAIRDAGKLNVEEEQILENIRTNLDGNWQEVSPHYLQETEVMVLAGGPSLAQFEDQIRQRRAEGVKLITLNGTYNWCLERGLTPSAQVMVDSRAFNARFTNPVVEDCKYLLASQVHPSVLEGLPHDRTFLWHTGMESARALISEKRPIWYSIPGGSTVMLRAIQLLLTLGYHRMHLYGFDSCLGEDDAHHAFAQPENDGAMVIPTMVGGRAFRCHASMISQAREFMDLVRVLGDELDIEVYGDGLIKHILTTGAEMSDAAETAE